MSASAAVAINPALAHALADELVLASRMLADLAYELGSDETTLRRHMTSLQKIDHVTQIQLAVSGLLRNPRNGEDRTAEITLDDMAQRLRHSL